MLGAQNGTQNSAFIQTELEVSSSYDYEDLFRNVV